MSSSPITYESVIGLEVHIQLNTCSKAFSSEANVFELSPNLNISAVTLGLPGTLPRANKEHVEKSLHLALALGCDIPQQTRFDRKIIFIQTFPKVIRLPKIKIQLEKAEAGPSQQEMLKERFVSTTSTWKRMLENQIMN